MHFHFAFLRRLAIVALGTVLLLAPAFAVAGGPNYVSNAAFATIIFSVGTHNFSPAIEPTSLATVEPSLLNARFSTNNPCEAGLAAGADCGIMSATGTMAQGPSLASMESEQGLPNPALSGMQSSGGSTIVTADVVIYGATPAGITAAIEAAKLGRQVVLLEPTQHIGGMMSNGLGETDTYSGSVIGGLALQFFKNVNSYLTGGTGGSTTYNFEPHVAEAVFNSMLAQYSNISLQLGASLNSVAMSGTTITSLAANNGITYLGTEYIDASYTGDLMAAAGVSYTVGRESSAQYNENGAGVGVPTPISNSQIDPLCCPRQFYEWPGLACVADSIGCAGISR